VRVKLYENLPASAAAVGPVRLPWTSTPSPARVFFGIIARQAIRRGTFTSVQDLIAAIRSFIDGGNDR